MERTTSSSFARITGAVAAIAEPPQIEVPTPISVVESLGSFNALPIINAVVNAAANVNTMTKSDCPPTLTTLNIFISKPSITMEYCKSLFDVNLIPSISEAPCFPITSGNRFAISIPINIAITGPPTSGKAPLISHDGIAISRQTTIPGKK